MSGSINPITNPQAWDYVIIGQVKVPILCKVTGFKRSAKWDKKDGKGTIGSTLTLVGGKAAEGTLTFYLWRPIDFYEWDNALPLFSYDPTKKDPKPVDIYYPSLADLKINSIVVDDIGAIEQGSLNMYQVVVEVTEYKPVPKKLAVSTATGSVSTQKGTTPGAAPDPIADAQQAEISRLMKKAAEP